MVRAIVGANWGDEGKGKITDMLAKESDIIIRFQGGSNAGHTIINDYGKFALHLLPSGVFYQHTTSIIGNGVALNIPYLIKEIQSIVDRGVPKPHILVSDRAQILMPYHVLFDTYEEARLAGKSFGSTKSGIAPFYSDKYAKIGFQVSELFDDDLLKEKAAYLSYPIDGLVAAYNDIAYGLSLGTTDKYPRHSLAFKFYNVEYETVLNAVEWTMGKSGQLTPTAVFEPVEIDGTSVSRASLHNVSIFKRFYLHKGDTVAVYKANQIIPQISRNMTRGYNTGEKFIIPKICPICGEPVSVVKENDSEVLMCMNAGCKGKLLGELNAFVGKKAHDINGLSEATLSLMIQRGLIESSIDLYHLKEKKEQLAYLPKMGAKKIGNLLKAIEDSRNTTLEKFIVGLNIPLIGSRAAKDIAKHEKTRTKELNLTKPINTFIVDAAENYDFTHIEGLGVERNNSIHNYFGENYDYVCALASQFTFQDDIVENITENTSLSGKKFCITGKLHIFANRDELVADIESKGGKVVSGVTKATDYLITNDKNSGSSKNKKASELNIPIISEEEYKNKLN